MRYVYASIVKSVYMFNWIDFKCCYKIYCPNSDFCPEGHYRLILYYLCYFISHLISSNPPLI